AAGRGARRAQHHREAEPELREPQRPRPARCGERVVKGELMPRAAATRRRKAVSPREAAARLRVAIHWRVDGASLRQGGHWEHAGDDVALTLSVVVEDGTARAEATLSAGDRARGLRLPPELAAAACAVSE